MIEREVQQDVGGSPQDARESIDFRNVCLELVIALQKRVDEATARCKPTPGG
jgi:hypothetical protein